MAKYEVSTGPLGIAGDSFSSLATELGTAQERLGAVLSGWPEGLPELRRQLATTSDSISDASRGAQDMARALWEISEIYSQAERCAFNDHAQASPLHAAILQPALLPQLRESSGLLFPGELVLPDWLQMAVLRYEQSRTGAETKVAEVTSD